PWALRRGLGRLRRLPALLLLLLEQRAEHVADQLRVAAAACAGLLDVRRLRLADGAVQAGEAALGVDLPRAAEHRPSLTAGEVAVAEVIGQDLDRPRIVVAAGEAAQVVDERGVGGPGPLGLVGQPPQFLQQLRHVAGLGLRLALTLPTPGTLIPRRRWTGERS